MVYLQSDLHSFQKQLMYQWVVNEDNCNRQTVLSAVYLISLSLKLTIIPYHSST